VSSDWAKHADSVDSRADSPTVAVLIACHNRSAATRLCLEALTTQHVGAILEVHVVDDGSTDATPAVLQEFSNVRLIRGSGSLYWAASMALAERSAMARDPDYLFWLNDDTVLDPGAIELLLHVSENHPGSIVVGATRDPISGAPTYGARVRASSWHPQRLRRLPPSDEVQFADAFNGNVVLVPRHVRDMVGPIDGDFPHAYADDDYGLRARALGIDIVQAPGFVAVCGANRGQAPSWGLKAWRGMQQSKGLPWRAQVRFLRRHGPWWWPGVLVAQTASRLIGRRPEGDR
jgi:GT2 family glycosyltransferase